MSGFKFECFYYPTIEHGEVVKTTRNVRSFEFGEEVPKKTLYYNYGTNFAIVFDKGTQLTIFNKEDLNSVRLLMSGEYEIEKELGALFFLSRVYNRKIKTIQYRVMGELTNSSRDINYINTSIEEQTKDLIADLQIVEKKFRDLVVENPGIKEKYLDYMNFGAKEDMFNLSINKYCVEGSEQYEYFKAESAVLKAKPIYPKFKLDHFMSSMNYH